MLPFRYSWYRLCAGLLFIEHVDLKPLARQLCKVKVKYSCRIDI